MSMIKSVAQKMKASNGNARISTSDMVWYLVERTDKIYNKIDNIEKDISSLKENTITKIEYENDKKDKKGNLKNGILTAIAFFSMVAAWVAIIFQQI